ncbi:MAG: hypothetical protein J1F28_00490 [Oscillospiraceae bacterium]|nr:hypothetical protein [Oscillospiraceae bacterium]
MSLLESIFEVKKRQVFSSDQARCEEFLQYFDDPDRLIDYFKCSIFFQPELDFYYQLASFITMLDYAEDLFCYLIYYGFPFEMAKNILLPFYYNDEALVKSWFYNCMSRASDDIRKKHGI